jgi:hypothetical protein
MVDPYVAVYRYYTADILTNTVIAELDLKDVSYERSIKAAGSFSGKANVLTNTSAMDLYESTLPGRTAIYILRNGECVWGGPIWSRNYDVYRKELTISAAEWPSYLHHRLIWKTYGQELAATCTVADGQIEIELQGSTFTPNPGSTVRLSFYEISDFQYNGFYTILESPTPTDTTSYATARDSMPDGTYEDVTVMIRTSTTDYVKQLVDATMVDFVNIQFPNDEITPALERELTIHEAFIQDGVAQIETESGQPHGFIVGQQCEICNLDATYNGYWIVTEVVNDLTFRLDFSENPVQNEATIAPSDEVYSVATYQLTAYEAKLFVSSTVFLQSGDTIIVNGVDDPASGSFVFDGVHTVSTVGPNFVTYITSSPTDVPLTAISPGATVTARAVAVNHTFGPFYANSDVDIEYSTRNKVPVYPTTAEIVAAGLPANLYPTTPTPVVAGNITLTARPLVTNSDGTVSTLFSESYNDGSNEVIYPRIINGELWSSQRAIDYYESTGQHLGKFASGNTTGATAYAQALSNIQDEWIQLFTYEWSETEYYGKNLKNNKYRGYELKNVGEELDEYSDTVDGFEYRIDCEYDVTTDSFKRILVLVPINFPDPPAPGQASPISRFGADQIVFEYPGNITDMRIEESAENAATRFFVVGDQGDLGDEASQPYAVASSTDLLSDGWPLLDAEESKSDEADEERLYDHAERYLTEARPPIVTVSITVNGGMNPSVGTYVPGDWCSLAVDDDFVRMRLASDLEPRDTVLVRKIDSFQVNVPNAPSFSENVTLTLVPEWEVDRIA